MHRLQLTLVLFASVAAAAPAVAKAQFTTLTTEGGFVFDMDGSGAVQNGTPGMWGSGPYVGCFNLTVNGAGYFGGTPTMSTDGRTATFPDTTVSGSLHAQRVAYVPMTGGDFIRYIDSVTNMGTSSSTVTVSYTCRFDNWGGTTIPATSSGDMTLTNVDDWATQNDVFGSGYAATGIVWSGASAMARIATVTNDFSGSFGNDHIDWSYSVTIPAGGRASFVIFGIQKGDTADADTMAEAARLVMVPDDVMIGADDYLDSIVNFQEDTPGAPRIRFMGPTEVNEGDAIDVMLNVIDEPGMASTWSWDLDGDGTFGDTPGATDYMVAAGTTDGPSTIRIGVQAMNSTAMSTRYRSITVNNANPAVTSDAPSTLTTNGSDYTYQFVVNDPAGAMDTLTYTCVMCPSTMTVSDTGFLQWTPGDLDVTMPAMPKHIQVRIDDEDGGSTTYAWNLTVLSDHPPSRPSIAYPNGITVNPSPPPRLVAGNATDFDGDPLSYVFEIDTVSTFDSPGKIVSPAIPQTDGFTAFTPTADLAMGTQYFWRVKANDTFVDSEYATASFYTSGTAPTPDAGTPDMGMGGGDGGPVHVDMGSGGDSRGGGCCTVAGTSGGGTGALLVLAALGLVVVSRRRR